MSCNFTDDVWTKKKFSTFSYKLVQISPIMILVNSGAFLSISSWFCELTELIFVMIPYISSTGYPPKTQGIMGHVQVENTLKLYSWSRSYGKQPLLWPLLRKIIYTSTFLKFHTHLEQNSQDRFKMFLAIVKGVKSRIFKKLNFS